PTELFRYGKIRKLEFRLLAFGGSSIPYNVYEEDISISTGNIAVTDGKEGVQTISCAKGIYGSILRIELGPTNFNFHRIQTKALVTLSGNQTDEKWIILEQPEGTP